MPVHNAEIADIFNRLADLLEIEGENPFRIRAYRNAARVISGMSKDIAILVEEKNDLTEIPGIGKGIAEKIQIILKTGKLPLLEKEESHIPAILIKLIKIENLGPKRAQRLYKELHIHNIKELNKALERGTIQKMKGFGKKTEQRIKEGLKQLSTEVQRFKLADTITIVESLLAYLKKFIKIEQVECAGSFRRVKETVGDLDILAIAEEGNSVINYFIKFDEIANVLSKGTTRSTVRLRSGIQVDLRVVPKKSYGAARLYFTGSKAHNIHLRKIAMQKKYKVNEYGLFKDTRYIVGENEQDIYHQLGLAYIEPELREDRGEIEAAANNRLPKLITLKDIRGDLHCHTIATDGKDTLEAMALAAINKNYEYIAITDHTKHLAITHGLDKKRLLQQIKNIDRLNEKLNKVFILKSTEVDILEDGSLDLPNDILKELDLTVCSIHSQFNLSQKKQTERIIRAMDNPYFNILAHPTGRLINKRNAYKIDLISIFEAAKERNCIMELNAQPERMDLDDVHCQIAKNMGLKIAISTDAHSIAGFDYMSLGIDQARRGWLEKKDVINTRSLNELLKILKRK